MNGGGGGEGCEWGMVVGNWGSAWIKIRCEIGVAWDEFWREL